MIKTVEPASEFASACDEAALAMGFSPFTSSGFAVTPKALAYSQ
jgi:hypothetical protein